MVLYDVLRASVSNHHEGERNVLLASRHQQCTMFGKMSTKVVRFCTRRLCGIVFRSPPQNEEKLEARARRVVEHRRVYGGAVFATIRDASADHQ